MPDLKVEHPAVFSDAILDTLRDLIPPGSRVLDPMAGTGRIHELDHDTWGIEIEPEWATLHPRTLIGDALHLPFPDHTFDVIATSPVYGNRMSDHHNARDDSKRITYRHKLGRPLHPHNSGQLQWGAAYRGFHEQAWIEAVRVLRPGGRFFLNVSDHIRKGERVRVSDWHVKFLTGTLDEPGLFEGPKLRGPDPYLIDTPRMRFGANSDKRVEHEYLFDFRKPE